MPIFQLVKPLELVASGNCMSDCFPCNLFIKLIPLLTVYKLKPCWSPLGFNQEPSGSWTSRDYSERDLQTIHSIKHNSPESAWTASHMAASQPSLPLGHHPSTWKFAASRRVNKTKHRQIAYYFDQNHAVRFIAVLNFFPAAIGVHMWKRFVVLNMLGIGPGKSMSLQSPSWTFNIACEQRHFSSCTFLVLSAVLPIALNSGCKTVWSARITLGNQMEVCHILLHYWGQ